MKVYVLRFDNDAIDNIFDSVEGVKAYVQKEYDLDIDRWYLSKNSNEWFYMSEGNFSEKYTIEMYEVQTEEME